MKQTAIVLALATSACTSTMPQMAAKPPFAMVHSQMARDAVANCLLDRISSDELIPNRQSGSSETRVAFNGRSMVARKAAIYLFVIRDDGSGSSIEVRRYPGATLAAAETCF